MGVAEYRRITDMRYPKKKPIQCTVTFYASGTNFCHNTQQKIEEGTCEACHEHYSQTPGGTEES